MADDLTETRELLASATPGPWEADLDAEAVATARDLDPVCSSCATPADAALIAAAPLLLAALADEVERLRAQVQAVRDLADAYRVNGHTSCYEETVCPDCESIDVADDITRALDAADA